MSIYDDDGFDEEAAELSEAITGSYTTSGGGKATGFNYSDDGGGGGGSTQGFTPGTSLPGGGTQIQGNLIKGGRIISDTTIGRGDYDRSGQQYKDYLESTGRSLQNPYGNQGLFSNIFGADKINYNLDPTTAQNILDAGFQRFTDFEGQDELSQKRGFGKLFGGPEGEMTAQGEVRKQITPMSTQESAGRMLASVMGLGLPTSMIEGGNVGYTPMGGGQYNPQLDPQVNPDVASGGGIMGLLSGGADVSGLGQTLKDQLIQAKDIITSKFNPPEVAAQQNKAAGPLPSFDPRQPDAMSQNMTPQPDDYAARVAEVLANLDPSKSISSDETVGISDIIKGTGMTPVKTYDLGDPGVLAGVEQAGGGSAVVQDIQEQLDKGRTGTFDSRTGKVQLSVPGTAFGLSYDLSDELGLSSGFDFDSFMDTLSPDTLAAGMVQERVTGSGDVRQGGPAFLKGMNK